MADITPNLGLTLPAYDESADIEVLNENFRKLDATAGGAGKPKEITYTALKELISLEQVVPNQPYIITDFKTTYLRMNRGISGDTRQVAFGDIERIIVVGNDKKSLQPIAYSEKYPEDIIFYDVTPATLNDIEPNTSSTAITGYIRRRIDTKRNIDCDFDFRNTQVWVIPVDVTTSRRLVGGNYVVEPIPEITTYPFGIQEGRLYIATDSAGTKRMYYCHTSVNAEEYSRVVANSAEVANNFDDLYKMKVEDGTYNVLVRARTRTDTIMQYYWSLKSQVLKKTIPDSKSVYNIKISNGKSKVIGVFIDEACYNITIDNYQFVLIPKACADITSTQSSIISLSSRSRMCQINNGVISNGTLASVIIEGRYSSPPTLSNVYYSKIKSNCFVADSSSVTTGDASLDSSIIKSDAISLSTNCDENFIVNSSTVTIGIQCDSNRVFDTRNAILDTGCNSNKLYSVTSSYLSRSSVNELRNVTNITFFGSSYNQIANSNSHTYYNSNYIKATQSVCARTEAIDIGTLGGNLDTYTSIAGVGVNTHKKLITNSANQVCVQYLNGLDLRVVQLP